MKVKKLSIIFILLISYFYSFAQDKILLTSGKYKFGEVLEVNNDYVFYQKHNSYRVKSILTNDIYQIDYEDSAKVTIYKMNEEEGFNLTVEEMDLYVLGEQDALNNYKAPWVTIGGLGAGAVGGVGLVPAFWGLLAPATYSGVAGLGIPKVKEGMIENTDLINNDYFMSGYQYTASQKKTKNALIGGVVGFAVTAGVVAIFAK